MSLERKMTRRSLAKSMVATGTAAGLSRLLSAQSPTESVVNGTSTWEQVHPGVWRARLGEPEKFTPVSSRLVPPQLGAFEKLPRVDTGALAGNYRETHEAQLRG